MMAGLTAVVLLVVGLFYGYIGARAWNEREWWLVWLGSFGAAAFLVMTAIVWGCR